MWGQGWSRATTRAFTRGDNSVHVRQQQFHAAILAALFLVHSLQTSFPGRSYLPEVCAHSFQTKHTHTNRVTPPPPPPHTHTHPRHRTHTLSNCFTLSSSSSTISSSSQHTTRHDSGQPPAAASRLGRHQAPSAANPLYECKGLGREKHATASAEHTHSFVPAALYL